MARAWKRVRAIEAGYGVLFTTATTLIEKLSKAHAEGRLTLYAAPRLLNIDEIGDLPIDRVGKVRRPLTQRLLTP